MKYQDFLNATRVFFLGTGRKNLDLVVASPKSLIQQIETADVVFLSGGETDKLLNTLKQSPDFAKVIIGKIVVGSSAGAYVLAKYYYSNSKDGALEGLGILPIKVACHYESKIHPISGNDPIAVLEEKGENLDIIALRDCEWKVLKR